MILVVVKNPIKPKYADEFPTLIAEFTEATRSEPGNVCFDWYRSVDDPNMYVLVEAFADRAAGDLHTTTAHFQKATSELGRYLADVPEIVNVEVPEGWSRMSEVS
jgi:quinol monooxygenase YgiN